MSAHGTKRLDREAARFVRITVAFNEAQDRWLNEMAIERCCSVSDILRRLVDETRGAYLTPQDARLAAE